MYSCDQVLELFCSFQDKDVIFGQEKAISEKIKATRWATFKMCSPMPFYKCHFPSGKWLVGERKDSFQHCFDENGNVVMIKFFYNDLFFYYDDRIINVYYEKNGIIISLRVYCLDQKKRVIKLFHVNKKQLYMSTYHWANAVLKSVDVLCREYMVKIKPETINNLLIKNEWKYEDRYEYGLNQKLEKIVRFYPSSGQETIEYQKKGKQTVRTVGKAIQDYLLQNLFDLVKAKIEDDEAYCLFLLYGNSNLDQPPLYLVATEAMLAKIGEDARWQPSEMGRDWQEFSDQAFCDQWQLFYQVMETEDNLDAAADVLKKVAKKLNKIQDYPFPVTQNFIVTVADSDDDVDLFEDLQDSVPKSKLKKALGPEVWKFFSEG